MWVFLSAYIPSAIELNWYQQNTRFGQLRLRNESAEAIYDDVGVDTDIYTLK